VIPPCECRPVYRENIRGARRPARHPSAEAGVEAGVSSGGGGWWENTGPLHQWARNPGQFCRNEDAKRPKSGERERECCSGKKRKTARHSVKRMRGTLPGWGISQFQNQPLRKGGRSVLANTAPTGREGSALAADVRPGVIAGAIWRAWGVVASGQIKEMIEGARPETMEQGSGDRATRHGYDTWTRVVGHRASKTAGSAGQLRCSRRGQWRDRKGGGLAALTPAGKARRNERRAQAGGNKGLPKQATARGPPRL